MIHLQNTYQFHPTSTEFMFFSEDALLFDIETTGLSKKQHQIYLIGCSYRQGNEICVHQFFAESTDEESEIIKAFLSLAQNFCKLITFNGIGFDVPFLLEKCGIFQLNSSGLPSAHLDIYRECKKIKSLLNLSSYKQKAIESFLGINRDDQYDGGQLISVYKSYIDTKSEDSLQLLLLHNYEDVTGMVQILPILSYCTILGEPFCVTSLQVEEYHNIHGQLQQELTFVATFHTPLPVPIRIHRQICHLFLEDTTLKGSIPLYQGTLRHYLTNYKDYVYLPQEDMVILKSMATCIAQANKEKATPANCCIKKEGMFLCLPSSLSLTENVYLFAESHTSKEYYISYDESIVDASFLEQYLHCFLNELS